MSIEVMIGLIFLGVFAVIVLALMAFSRPVQQDQECAVATRLGACHRDSGSAGPGC